MWRREANYSTKEDKRETVKLLSTASRRVERRRQGRIKRMMRMIKKSRGRKRDGKICGESLSGVQ